MTRFIAFISLYLFIYGGMHAYFFFKIRAALTMVRWQSVTLALFLIIMVLSPILMWRLGDFGLDSLVKPIAMLTYNWMGFLFLVCAFYLVLDLYSFVLSLFKHLAPGIAELRHANRGLVFATVSLLCIGIAVHGYFAAREIRVDRVALSSESLPEEQNTFRIVQISDVHLGVTVDTEWFERVVERINELEPDLVVATGDIIDRHVDGAEEFTRIFSRLEARVGKYAVTGNHEFFAGVDKATAFMQNSGFVMLRGERVTIDSWLHLVGVDDRAGERFDALKGEGEYSLLQQHAGDGFTLLLKHQPIIEEGSLGRYDLQLSGHVHQGQIFPFTYLTRLFYPVASGMSDWGKGSKLYVSRGTGTWGPPIRFLAPPEITLFEIERN